VFESGFGRGQSVAEGPRAPREEWIAARPGVAKGHVEQTTVASKLLGTTRDVWVYTPPGYDTLARSGGLPLLLTFDGGEYVRSVPGPTILDNLIAARRIAPMVAVFVASADDQRDAELGANERYVEFLATELVPWIRSKYHITSSPAGNVVAGSSLGGLAAAFVAYKHPELFGNVLSQSGAFMFGAPGESTPERLKRDIEAAPRRDVRFYLEAGIYEVGRTENGVDLLTSNRHLRDALRAKGYRVTYDEFAGGHSDLNWRTGYAKGLLALVGR
jgi:enterochelin esterase family protein